MGWLVANRSDPPAENTPPATALDYASIKAACEGSLRRLQTHYIDLYQLHWPQRVAPLFGMRQYNNDTPERPHNYEEQVRAPWTWCHVKQNLHLLIS